ncbi:MAG: efflux RND transporter periplasmic adaptor subunit [Chitinivibrionales bacterium]|nr:efflux RND transporter periplasmic adaptor subunit [Chitinivibrionales bacterium]
MKIKRYSHGTIRTFVLVFTLVGLNSCSSSRTNYGDKKSYQFTQIQRGDIAVVVSSTGTLTAEGAVDVGTEVSGTVAKVFVDFNAKVTTGQVLAELKTDLLDAAIRDAQANLSRARAQNNQAVAEYNQNLPLFEKGYLSSREFLPIKTNLETAKATLQSAQAALDRAKTNLSYARIRSPIDGIILERNIEAGQTVAASFSTPTLFVIARDLSKMEIEALVDESDISQVKEGMNAEFVVSAYPDKTFRGTVAQIRRKPVTVQNVVNYTVIVQAENEANELLPGMTATIDFTVSSVSNVLMVSNDALRFRPDEKMLRFFRQSNHQSDSKQSYGEKNRISKSKEAEQSDEAFFNPAAPIQRAGKNDSLHHGDRGNGMNRLWYFDATGVLKVQPVKVGLTDGTVTELLEPQHLMQGASVIKSMAKTEKTAATNQFSNGNRSRQGGGPHRPPGILF